MPFALLDYDFILFHYVQPVLDLFLSYGYFFFGLAGNPRNKTALKPGHSLIDWIRLGGSGRDLAGTRGVITPVSHAELAKHNKIDDAWLAIRGKVYNVTHYFSFHPGGE
jgi:cytochrome b involved in lipid metabolism